MNWAHRLIKATPCQNHISAMRYVDNDFDHSGLHFHHTGLLKKIRRSSSEWEINWPARFYAKFFRAYHARSILKYIRENNIDILHFHFATVAARYVELIQMTPQPCVVSFYGYDYEYAPTIKPRLEKAYRQLFEIVDIFIVEGDNGKKTLESKKCPLNKVKIVRLGVDPEHIKLEHHQKHVNSLHLVQPATFKEKKAQLDTLRALRQALPFCPDLKLTLVGENPGNRYFKQCQKYIQKHKLHDHVTYHMFIPFKRWYSELANFDVLIQPSKYSTKNDCEGGVPVSIIDAHAVGLPVISTKHCDIPGVVINGSTGILVEEGDIGALKDAIIELYTMNDRTYQEFRRSAKDHIHEHFNIRDSGVILNDIYENLIS